ncbi:MAG: Gfo/Idh/MocA family oxidoreductase [Candidatus Aureabacteria bacterium]|nr:Gfo/Idh/MocA family oxidoreductase [Candidatus Auribacterota bacterium]
MGSAKKMLDVAVIGVGHLGQHHARIFHLLEKARLRCVVDVDESQGRKIAKKYRCDYYQNYRDVPEDVDCVSIAVPTVLHFEVASCFIGRGKHIFLEKPITRTVEEAVSLVDLSKNKNIVFQVGHIERYNPVLLAVKDIIKDPRFIEVHRLAPFKARSVDIGVVLDLMIHDIDIILTILNNPIKDIKAIGVPVLGENEDIANARLEFEGGCVANISVSRISMKEMRKIRIFQEKTYISLDYKDRKGMIYEMQGKKIVPRKIPIQKEEPLKLELDDFCESCLLSRDPVVSAEHGKRALSVAVEIVKQISQS